MIRDFLTTALQNKNTAMFITAIVFMCGILSYFNDNGLVFAGIISVLAIVAILKNFIPTKYILLWLFVFYFGFFNSCLRIKMTDNLASFAPEKATIQGQIVSIPNSNSPNKTKFFFKVKKINNELTSGKTLVTYSGNGIEKLQIGDEYELSGKLQTPFKAGNPSQFDYGKYLRNFDTFSVFYAKSANNLNSKLTPKWKFLQSLNKVRDRIVTVHAQYLKSPNLEILGGIVFGDDAVAPPDYIKTSFVNSGLLHILAASGMNVAFIYGFWVFFMKKLRCPFKLTVLSGIGIIIIYTLMTGLGASVIRAALMLILILLGKLIDRDAHTVSLLAFVAVIMLIYNPAYINDVGFQLSFIVTFGLLTTANVIFERFKDSKIPQWLIGAALIPVIAQIWVAPIQMFYFNTFSTYSVFANVCSMPFLSVISFGGFVSSILAAFSPFTDKICMVMDFILNYFLHAIVFISKFFSTLSHSLISTSHPSVFQIILYYAIIFLFTLSIKIGFSKKLVITIAGICLVLAGSFITIPSKSLDIIAFDVQNADCFLIKTPENKYFIIDTGRAGYNGGKAQANSIIIKYLKDRGIKNIEGLIITHFDNDHSGGATDIMKSLRVKKVYLNSYSDDSMTSKNIYKTIEKLGINSQIPTNNNSIYAEKDLNLKTYFINSETDNEKSIITLLSYKDFDMLFTGDAGVKAFKELKNSLPRNVEVLKVGHHGGPRVVNNDMLDYFKTQVSIISTGPNAFGHPNRGTLDLLRNTEIYRTDRHNSVKITSDGKSYNILTYNKHKKKYVFSKSLEVIKP